MKTFMIKDNDLVLDKNMNLVFVEDSQEEVQSLERALTTNIDEWFLHDNHGFAYDYIFSARPFDEERAHLEVVKTLYQDPRVIDVLDVSFTADQLTEDRLLMIEFTVRMINRDYPVTGKVEVNGFITASDDYYRNIKMPIDAGSVSEEVATRIDVGFVADSTYQEIEYGEIYEKPTGFEDYGLVTDDVTESDDFGFFNEAVTRYISFGGVTNNG